MDNQRLELKNQALLERVSEITTTYENRVADLRVEVTLLTQQKQALEQEVNRLNELVPKDNEDDYKSVYPDSE